MTVLIEPGGPCLTSAFERVVECMFNYMTDLSHVDIDAEETIELTVEGETVASNCSMAVRGHQTHACIRMRALRHIQGMI